MGTKKTKISCDHNNKPPAPTAMSLFNIVLGDNLMVSSRTVVYLFLHSLGLTAHKLFINFRLGSPTSKDSKYFSALKRGDLNFTKTCVPKELQHNVGADPHPSISFY